MALACFLFHGLDSVQFVQLFHLQSLEFRFLGQDENAFYHLYCVAFRLLGAQLHIWNSM
jgi:hypothetical protein